MKNKFTLLIIALMVISFSSLSQTKGTFTDTRDGKVYKTITIGTQTWMAENLNYNAENSWCYENSSSNCDKYGRLYDWNAANKACPNGWHLPSKSEFETLLSYVGGSGSNAYNALKVGGTSSFNALYGGLRYGDSGEFENIGTYGYCWTSSLARAGRASYMDVSEKYGANVELGGFSIMVGLSVRCIKD